MGKTDCEWKIARQKFGYPNFSVIDQFRFGLPMELHELLGCTAEKTALYTFSVESCFVALRHRDLHRSSLVAAAILGAATGLRTLADQGGLSDSTLGAALTLAVPAGNDDISQLGIIGSVGDGLSLADDGPLAEHLASQILTVPLLAAIAALGAATGLGSAVEQAVLTNSSNSAALAVTVPCPFRALAVAADDVGSLTDDGPAAEGLARQIIHSGLLLQFLTLLTVGHTAAAQIFLLRNHVLATVALAQPLAHGLAACGDCSVCLNDDDQVAITMATQVHLVALMCSGVADSLCHNSELANQIHHLAQSGCGIDSGNISGIVFHFVFLQTFGRSSSSHKIMLIK